MRARNGRGTPSGTVRLLTLVTVAATAATVTAAPAAAGPSSGTLPGSRISVAGQAVQVTATHGDVLYLGGDIAGLGYRSAGLAAFDRTAGAPDLDVPELEGAPGLVNGAGKLARVARVVADGRGGVYALGVESTATSFEPVQIAGAPLASDWLRIDAEGHPDLTLAARFVTDDGDAASITDLTVATDGTTYVAGDFARVDGTPRDGLAALDAEGRLTGWQPPAIGGGTLARLEAAGDGVLAVGGGAPFTTVDGQARSGLALLDGATGALRAWKPAGLTSADAHRVAVGQGAAFLLGGDGTLRKVGLTGSGSVSVVPIAGGAVQQIATAGDKLYLSGSFTAIGPEGAPQPRPGLAEIEQGSGALTGWTPPAAAPSNGRALTVAGDVVYASTGRNAGVGRCGVQAFDRTTGQLTSWRATIGHASDCGLNLTSLAVSGGRVWAGGGFRQVDVRNRTGWAAVDVARDEILDWAPSTGEGTQPAATDITVSSDGTRVYLASSGMTTLNGVARNGAAAVRGAGSIGAREDADDAADVLPWDPAPDGPVTALALSPDGQTAYLGGTFRNVGSASRDRIAAVDATSGALRSGAAWTVPTANSGVVDLEVAGDGAIFVAGNFTSIGGQARRRIAKLGPDGTTDPGWNAALYSTPTNGRIDDLALGTAGDGTPVVYAAGAFDGSIGGSSRHAVVQLLRTTGSATAWDAQVDRLGTESGAVLGVSVGSDGAVYLAGPASLGGRHAVVDQQDVWAVSSGGVLAPWAPASVIYGQPRAEIREVAGRVIVPGVARRVYDGVPQTGFLVFGPATAPAALDPAVPPTIAGLVKPDVTVRCTPGSYSGSRPMARTYAWLRDGQAIAGQSQPSYTVRAADLGAELACRERVENPAGTQTATSATIRVVGGIPVVSVEPEVSGTARPGQTVTCSTGVWDNLPDADGYRYAWLRNGQPIAGAAQRGLPLTTADVGSQVACEVVARNRAGESLPARSAARTVTAIPGDGGPGELPGGDPPREQPKQEVPQPGPPIGDRKAPPAPVAASLRVGTVTSARKRRVSLAIVPSAAGRIQVQGTVVSGKGKRRKSLTVLSGTVSAKRSGTARVVLKLTAAGRRTLRVGRSTKVTFRVTFTPSSGARKTVTRTLSVKLRR